MQMITDNIELLTVGSYFFTFACVYLVVSFVFYTMRMSQIKILNITLDAKKNQARGRKLVTDAVSIAKEEKKKALLWPVFMFSGLISYVKKKNTKKE